MTFKYSLSSKMYGKLQNKWASKESQVIEIIEDIYIQHYIYIIFIT